MPDWLTCILEWLDHNADAITAFAAIAATIIALIGFGLTIAQLYQTQLALRAGNTYAIQKDGRELVGEIFGDGSFSAFLEKPNKRVTATARAAARRKMGLLANFYLSVFRQHKAGGITPSLYKSMGDDFASFLKNAIVREFFIERLRGGAYGDEHKEMVRAWCADLAPDIERQGSCTLD